MPCQGCEWRVHMPDCAMNRTFHRLAIGLIVRTGHNVELSQPR